MNDWVIRLLLDGADPTDITAGPWLQHYDPLAAQYLAMHWTDEASLALRYASRAQALAEWQRMTKKLSMLTTSRAQIGQLPVDEDEKKPAPVKDAG